jgi:hypothetical protein
MSDGMDFGGHVVMTEVLHQAGRVDELDEFLKSSGDFQADPRGQIMVARVQRVRKQWAECEQTLRRQLATALSNPLKRICGFELSRCLDAQGRYTESWQAAATAHRETAKPFAIDLLVAALKMTAEISVSELRKIRRASAGIPNTACILGMPRSGTSILEQMLDRHSRICGRGESGLPGEIGDAIAKQGGGWPVGVLNVSVDALNQLQALSRLAANGGQYARRHLVYRQDGLSPNATAGDCLCFTSHQSYSYRARCPGQRSKFVFE